MESSSIVPILLSPIFLSRAFTFPCGVTNYFVCFVLGERKGTQFTVRNIL